MVIRILIEEASDLTLLGTQMVLEEDYRFTVTGTARGMRELLEQAAHSEPDIILFGGSFYSDDILTAIEKLRTAAPTARLIMMGGVTDGRFIHDLFLAGVRAYLCRGDDLRTVLPHAIVMVMRERLYLSPTANSEYLVTMQRPQKHWHLDIQARQVLKRLVQGQHMTDIARLENISLRRVYWLRQKLRRRFDATTNEQLILRAVDEGFVCRGE